MVNVDAQVILEHQKDMRNRIQKKKIGLKAVSLGTLCIREHFDTVSITSKNSF